MSHNFLPQNFFTVPFVPQMENPWRLALLSIRNANARDTPHIEVLARIDTAFDGHLVLPVRLIKEPKLETLAPNPERALHANDRTPIPLWNRVVVHGLLANHVTNYLHSG